jgi:pilus assembly protein Flp/PilA
VARHFATAVLFSLFARRTDRFPVRAAGFNHSPRAAMNKILRFLRSEEGPTTVEYAVMLGMIVMAALSSITLLGQETSSSFSNTRDKISTAMSSAS